MFCVCDGGRGSGVNNALSFVPLGSVLASFCLQGSPAAGSRHCREYPRFPSLPNHSLYHSLLFAPLCLFLLLSTSASCLPFPYVCHLYLNLLKHFSEITFSLNCQSGLHCCPYPLSLLLSLTLSLFLFHSFSGTTLFNFFF